MGDQVQGFVNLETYPEDLQKNLEIYFKDLTIWRSCPGICHNLEILSRDMSILGFAWRYVAKKTDLWTNPRIIGSCVVEELLHQ